MHFDEDLETSSEAFGVIDGTENLLFKLLNQPPASFRVDCTGALFHFTRELFGEFCGAFRNVQ